MAGVTLKNVVKRFGQVEVIHGASLEVEDGEFVVFVGPSGCGKSTLLRMIAGLEDITSGEIFIGGELVNDVEPADRGTAMVFQSYALYPHMSVEQNLSFGLRMTGNDKQDTARRVAKAAEILRINELLHRRPKQLSGGQRQRVAIGRAIVREPSVFLFDEPLSNLDAELRVQMRVEISRLHSELGTTMIYVTHDQIEAMTLADKIVVLRDGIIEQVGKPLELYDNPANQFVAGFVGSPKMNFMSAKVLESGAGKIVVELVNQGGVRLAKSLIGALPEKGSMVTIGVRPEHFGEPGQGDVDLNIRIDVAEHIGSTSYAYANTTEGEQLIIQRGAEHRDTHVDAVQASMDAASAMVFAADGLRMR